ncbi:MAG: GlsB/YeaQ/YmgE family stress response membrane protein [Acidimicrobiales bacterium]
MLWFIIVLFVVGLVVGAIARLLVPGTGGIGIFATAVIGIVGSFVGGFLGYLIFHKNSQNGALQPSGFIGSLIGAVIILLIYRRLGTGRSGRRTI